MQDGMLVNHLFAQESGVDVEQIIVSLQSQLNIQALRQAWERVAARHSALRTRFLWEGLPQPLQQVEESIEVPLSCEDLRRSRPAEQESRLEEFLAADRRAGFHLAHPPLMRLKLFRLADDSYDLIWTFHHALLDGRSFPIVLKEVFGFYDASVEGRDLELAPAFPYRDYIEWLENRDFSRAEAYWRRSLAGFTAPTPLEGLASPTDRTGSREERGEQRVRLSDRLTAGLQDLCSANDLSLNTFVQGAWGLLLARYSGYDDVVFGAVRACRSSTTGASEMVGMFMNTVPVRVQVKPDLSALDWLKSLRATQIAVRDYEHTPLNLIQLWSEVPGGTPLFESLLVFDNYLLNDKLRAQGGTWLGRSFQCREKTPYPLTLYCYGGSEVLLKIAYARNRFGQSTIQRMLAHLATLLEGIASNPATLLSELPVLSESERRNCLQGWQGTHVPCQGVATVHELVEEAARQTPQAVAAVFEDEELSYADLNERADQLAGYLRRSGVSPGVLVGIAVERSLEMLVGILAILKSGGAYVPLDPRYPSGRLAFMIEDSRAAVVLTQQRLQARLPQTSARIVCLDTEWDVISRETTAAYGASLAGQASAEDLAYVIYTSGSTGQPKGVMVEHRNVINFFAAMDRELGTSAGVWLAVTSIAFDISVLELLWTLSRGYRVIIQSDAPRAAASGSVSQSKSIDFSLFYFASGGDDSSSHRYRLLLEGARFADRNGFAAVWTPERHFHAFGGLFPNPAVSSAAVAAVTEHIQIRAGSVVLPLHDPIRVTEEWSMVDNLSNGRVGGISFASGWQVNDFVLAPDRYASAKHVMLREIETVRRLWRGEAVRRRNGNGVETDVRTLPRPMQPELPVWITAAGNPETFQVAGERGFNLLTHLLGQRIEVLAEKIQLYRQAWKEAGHIGPGYVSLMVHTFVGPDMEEVRRRAHRPFCDYLKASVDLIRNADWHFPAFQVEPSGQEELTDGQIDAMVEYAFDRYFEHSGIFGTPDSCQKTIDHLKEIGVDEVACLIDFGVDTEACLAGLEHLNTLKQRAQAAVPSREPYSIAEQIERQGVTHLQITPSLGRMLLGDQSSRQAIRGLHKLLVGGEVFPVDLAQALRNATNAEIYNMYGPTETTVWSTAYRVDSPDAGVTPIGRPIANTTTLVLDKNLQLVPTGVRGELFVGGAGVTRGYWDRPGLTGERFVPNPFGEGRLFRTGDLVRQDSNGVLEFVGRKDQQVKIRGHRVELGEIESVLRQHPEVQDAVASVRRTLAGEPCLVAYLVPVGAQYSGIDSVRDFARKRLPDPMIPSVFVLLKAMPLTANGKIDRNNLPPPFSETSQRADAITPCTELEKIIAAVWQDVLPQAHVGLDDNFFDLGGHSLLLVRVHSRLKEQLGREIPLIQSFRHPTVRLFAASLSIGDSSRPEAGLGLSRAEIRKRALSQRIRARQGTA
jgi:natural product biosynthesis luciferase-like monooxygenase protein